MLSVILSSGEAISVDGMFPAVDDRGYLYIADANEMNVAVFRTDSWIACIREPSTGTNENTEE